MECLRPWISGSLDEYDLSAGIPAICKRQSAANDIVLRIRTPFRAGTAGASDDYKIRFAVTNES
jgi:hypothetical protein